MAKRLFFIAILIIFGGFLRFYELGYSHFYGDETKVFYMDKSVSAREFFFDQRKGPAQFFVVWVSEKIMGGHSELLTRLPFALAGLLCVVVFYLVAEELFGKTSAFVSALLFSVSGFFVAFSRTIQYQSFLLLFGLLSIYLCLLYLRKKHPLLLTASSLFLGLAFYAHYDAIFFCIPILHLLFSSYLRKETTLKYISLSFFFPLLIFLAVFYLPYLLSGCFHSNALNYLLRRVVGKEYLVNNSLYTFYVYNPTLLALLPLISSLVVLFYRRNFKTELLFLWFIVPFVMFQLVFLNPGTHILNYFIPLYLVSGHVITSGYHLLRKKQFAKSLYTSVYAFLMLYLFVVALVVYIPKFNLRYPWVFKTPNPKYHLFLYGFPYNRGWDQIEQYFSDKSGVRGVYTNDNDTLAQYYLKDFDYTPPGSNFLPPYYIHVYSDQDIYKTTVVPIAENYKVEKQIYVENELTATIFKLKTL